MSVYFCTLAYCLKLICFCLTAMLISNFLKIEKGITAVIGGGGKTTLLHILAKELSTKGTVVITTTTHIMKSEVFCNVLTSADKDNLSYIGEQLALHRCIVLGSEFSGEKLKAPDVSIDELSSFCDYVLVEADGSKHLPLKAHLPFEPVIPECTYQTILVVGVDAVGKSLKETTHRSERAAELLSCGVDSIVTPLLVAKLINLENLHDKVVINKCDSDNLRITAEQISEKINTECVISSLLKGEWYVSSN